MKVSPICPYCGAWSKKVTGKDVYPHRPDLFKKVFYRCEPCDAYVGCHDGTEQPLGRLADSNLRAAKQRAHAAFDPLWKSGPLSRKEAYAWLAQQMGVEVGKCHIGFFDSGQCAQVVAICANRRVEK